MALQCGRMKLDRRDVVVVFDRTTARQERSGILVGWSWLRYWAGDRWTTVALLGRTARRERV
jgi:hypothetical protein